MVSAEATADLGQARVGELTREIHGDLTSESDPGAAITGEQAVAREVEGGRGRVLDRLEAGLPGRQRRRGGEAAEDRANDVRGDPLAAQGRVGHDADEAAL